MKHLTHVASRFVNTPLMIHPPKLEVIIKAIGPRLGIDPEAAMTRRVPMDATATLMSRYEAAGDERDYSVIDGIAVIPVQGTLLKKESFMSAWSGSSSYEQIQRQMADAVADAGVSAILLDIDSPGGETAGCFDLADYIFSVRDQKPVWAVANDIALSAAYAIASSASKIYLNRTGAVGSIGVYALHMDQSGFDKDLGVKYTYVFAGAHKVDANPHEPLSERAQSDIQDEVDREYGIFTETVARNRKASKKEIVGTQASVQWADNAIPLLADEIGTFDDAMNVLRGAISGSAKVLRSGNATGQLRSDVVVHPLAAQPAASKGDASMPEIEVQAAAAKKDGEPEEKQGKKPEETQECDNKGKKEKQDGEEDEQDGADGKKGKPKEKEDGKKAAAVTLTPGEPLKAMRAESDIQAIAALCKMAGKPDLAAEFLMKKNSKGEYMSVAEVSAELTATRVAESESHMVDSKVNPNAGSGGVAELEAQATSFARQNRGQATQAMYVNGATTKVTKERAYAAMLEEHPEAYAAFRAQHNAKGMIATLEAAGIRLAR
jgi:signal peptide peptidase SppA